MSDNVYKRAISRTAVLEIKYDSDLQNPREESDGYFSEMVAWHRKYHLGDAHRWNDTEHLFLSLAENYIDTHHGKQVMLQARKKFFQGVSIQGDVDKWWVIDSKGDDYGHQTFETKKEAKCWLWEEKQDWLIRAVEHELKQEDLVAIFEPFVVIMPLWFYDHSGSSISTRSFRGRAQHAEWDSGQVGWIYAKKEQFLSQTAYPEYMLFGTAPRPPKPDDYVNVKGHESKGQGRVVKVKGNSVTVSWDYSRNYKLITDNAATVDISSVETVFNHAERMLTSEVEEYDMYHRGEGFGFVLYDVDTDALDEYLEGMEQTLEDTDFEEIAPYLTETNSGWGFLGEKYALEEGGIKECLDEKYRPLLDLLENVH